MAEVFDKDGKYVRTDWETGDRITASKLNKIELSIEAVNDNDIARHVEADSRLDALESGLTEAKNELNTKINNVETAYKAADSAMTTRVDDMESAYKAADTTLQNNINSMNTTLTNRINTVESEYKAADSAMTTRVNNVETAYKAADTTLQNNINSMNTTLTNRINTVESEYKAADTAIQNAIPTKVSQLTNDSNYADKAYVDNAVDSVDVTSQLSDYAKKIDLSSYATTSFVTSQLNNLTTGSNVPTYVITEAQMVADKVIEKRNAYSLVISAMSDLHTTGSDTSATGVLHAFQGINEIDKLTPIDMVAIHGDVIVLKMDDTYKDGLKYVRTCMNEVTKNIPLIHMQGNHDELNTDTTEEARQKYFRYIGANNVDVTTDFGNRFRNYGYKDFDDLRIRFIYLNSADLSDFEQTGDLWITPMQYNWFINKALDFSDKEGSEDWQWIVACHHPLNWGTPVSNLQLILKAYTEKTTGSFTFTDPVEGSSTISYDFTNAKQKLICHVHGHIHNFRTEWFDDVLSVTVPNACFGRNNEYGTAYGDGSWAQITGGDADENGVQRQFNKTSNTANDTAFVTLVIDSRVNNKIYAYCYGAGIDREINLTTKEVKYIDKVTTDDGGDTSEIPNEVLQYTNLVSTSIDSDGSVYNGVGYKDNIYLTSSTGLPTDVNGYVTTGFIEFTREFYVYSTNAEWIVGDSYCRLYSYKSDYSLNTGVVGSSITDILEVTDMGNNITKFKIIGTGTWDNAVYMRITFKGVGEGLYVYSMTQSGENTETLKGNLLPQAIDTDGTIYNGTGFKHGWRLSGDTGLAKEDVSYTLTGFIPWTIGDVVRIKNITSVIGTDAYIWTYDEDFNPLNFIDNQLVGMTKNVLEYTWDTWTSSIYANAKYIRISIAGTLSSSTVITVNEEITDDMISQYSALYTNLIPRSVDTDGTVFDLDGYKTGYRINSSGNVVQADGMCCTGRIRTPDDGVTRTIRVKNVNVNSSPNTPYLVEYDKNGTYRQVTELGGTGGLMQYDDSGELLVGTSDLNGYFAITCAKIDHTSIFTIDEEIPCANLVQTSINSDGTIYNVTGYKEGYRGNSSGTETALEGAIVSGYIPFTNGDVIRIYGNTTANNGATGNYVNFYNSSFTHELTMAASNLVTGMTYELLDDKYMLTIDTSAITESSYVTAFNDSSYIRCSLSNCTGDYFVVTINEEFTGLQ